MNIRNFVIIAHIDHGKSTLADRFLELTQTVEKRKMKEQILDQMELEREKGITIKMQPVRMIYKINHSEFLNPKSEILNKSKIQNSKSLEIGNSDLKITSSEFILNLIDTPGHVDFTYEVSRALAAVEGAILLVDATQGIQAQTLANLHLAQKENLAIIPVINKIDLPNAQVEETKIELAELLKISPDEILAASGKDGTGVAEVLAEVGRKVPAPEGDAQKPFKALIFDSQFDAYKGIIAHIRVIDGEIKSGEKITLIAGKTNCDVLEVGVFSPALEKAEKLSAGEIGYIATGVKEPAKIRVGDTVAKAADAQSTVPFSGYQEVKPMVFASVYPESADDFDLLKDSISKLKLNDAALSFEPESSDSLGRGFRCGFLGMLHMEIIGERLRREYGLNLIFTTPSTAYEIIEKGEGKKPLMIFSAGQMPDPSKIAEIREPWVVLEIVAPANFLGRLNKLMKTTRSEYKNTEYLGLERLFLVYETPLSEIIVDFYDRLKSVSEGHASMNYRFMGYRTGDLVKMDILVAGEPVNAFSRVVPRPTAYLEGKEMVERLKKILPRQQFAVSLQAAIGGTIIARETIGAMKKDVTGYLYGGDYTRKMKLWEKQKKGKKKLKERGSVNIPPEIFLKVLKKEN